MKPCVQSRLEAARLVDDTASAWDRERAMMAEHCVAASNQDDRRGMHRRHNIFNLVGTIIATIESNEKHQRTYESNRQIK